jgi:hypothetical protein
VAAGQRVEWEWEGTYGRMVGCLGRETTGWWPIYSKSPFFSFPFTFPVTPVNIYVILFILYILINCPSHIPVLVFSWKSAYPCMCIHVTEPEVSNLNPGGRDQIK